MYETSFFEEHIHKEIKEAMNKKFFMDVSSGVKSEGSFPSFLPWDLCSLSSALQPEDAQFDSSKYI